MRKLNFSKNSFKNTIRVSNSLEPDQHHHYVGPVLGPSCLQRLISRRQELMMTCYVFHRLLKRLRKKNKSQIELEQKEQGFSVYVNGPHKDGQVAQTQRGTSSKNIPTQPLKTSRTPKTAGGENKQGLEKQAVSPGPQTNLQHDKEESYTDTYTTAKKLQGPSLGATRAK